MKTMTIDEISIISDNELRNRIEGIKNLLTYNSKRNSVPLQVDLCYLQREAEIRVARRSAHEEYISEIRKKSAERYNSRKNNSSQKNNSPRRNFST